MNQQVAVALLKKLGYRYEVVADGAQALRALESGHYDLALMDVEMPVMDGHEVTRRVRARESGGEHLPIVAMTALSVQGDRERCLEAGMDDYVSKPIQLQALRDVLARYLGAEGLEPSASGAPLPERESSAVLDIVVVEELRRVLGERYPALLRTYLTDTPQRVALLREALGRGDRELLRREAHALKGASASLGATPLAQACEALFHGAVTTSVNRLLDRIAEIEWLHERVAGELQRTWPDAAASLPESTPEREAPPPASDKATLLVVDDDPLSRGVMSAGLRRAGYRVLEVGDGPAALAAVQADIPDMILLDAVMPDMDGFGVCHALRTSGLEDVPILMMTALEDDNSVHRAFAAGASDYLTKPMQTAVLVHRVRRTLTTERSIRQLAYHDPLTGLPNRALFADRLTHALAQQQTDLRPVALLLLDLDRFRIINDAMGHDTGDALLQEVGRRITSCMPGSETVARLGGDEFAVLIDPALEPDDVAGVASLLNATLKRPIQVPGQEVVLTASIGIAFAPGDGAELGALMKHAGTALHRAKDRGRDRYEFYRTDMSAHVSRRLSLEHGLRCALDNDEFEVRYQPQVELASGRISGAEVLLRWNHATFGEIAPVEFIPLAEETGMIVPLGARVLQMACEQLGVWQSQGLPRLRIAVNLSGVQLRTPGLVTMVGDILAKSGVPGDQLELEITEGVMMRNPDEAVTLLHALRDMGIGLAIDDFGTGYSSLSYLRRLPVDTLKVDRAFVRNIPDDADDAAITSAVIALGRTLNLLVVAEGVETKAQASFLRERGCDFGQGFYFGHPLDAGAFAALLAAQS